MSWSVYADNPNRPAGEPVTLTIRAGGTVTTVLTAEDARALSDALYWAAEHEGHDGDLAKPNDCQFCAALEEAEAAKWGRAFGVFDADGNETGRKLRIPHQGDPDFPAEGTCSACGVGHYVDPNTGRCDPGCETCSIGRADSDIWVFPCVWDRLLGAADMRQAR